MAILWNLLFQFCKQKSNIIYVQNSYDFEIYFKSCWFADLINRSVIFLIIRKSEKNDLICPWIRIKFCTYLIFNAMKNTYIKYVV